jgi:hypothetical protein
MHSKAGRADAVANIHLERATQPTYANSVGVEWAAGADRFGNPHGDALYAIQHAVLVSDRVTSAPEFTEFPRRVFIGPPHGQSGRLLEVLVEVRPGGLFVIYHVMQLSAKYRALLEVS